MSSVLLFAERNSRVQQLQPSPQAIESFQHVLHTGLKVRLNLEETNKGICPVREECERDYYRSSAFRSQEKQTRAADLTSAAGSRG